MNSSKLSSWCASFRRLQVVEKEAEAVGGASLAGRVARRAWVWKSLARATRAKAVEDISCVCWASSVEVEVERVWWLFCWQLCRAQVRRERRRMGLDGGFVSMSWRFSWDGRVTWEHGPRGNNVDCASQMGYKTRDVDAPNVKIERCEKTFTHISWIKLWTVRLDVELESSYESQLPAP